METSDSSSSDSSSSDSDEEQAMLLIQLAMQNTVELFQSNEWEENVGQETVNPHEGVRDVLGSLMSTPGLFKSLTNFSVPEFQELCQLVCPTIVGHARSTGAVPIVSGRPSKLSPEQRLLSFLLYMKHDPTTALPSFLWNWSRSSALSDQVYVASCICWALRDEIKWPDVKERQILASMVPALPGCIGIIDGTLVEVRKPWENPDHKKWFNRRKKMYSLNNVVIVDHHGLFIYIDSTYPGSFHDVSCLRASQLHGTWRDHFVHNDMDQAFEYVLGDPGYDGTEMYIMRRIQGLEIGEGISQEVVHTWNKMQDGYRIQVEWGIGGLKQKWGRLMKRFDNRRPRFRHFFEAAAKLTNFLHRRHMDFDKVVPQEREENEDQYGWGGDF